MLQPFFAPAFPLEFFAVGQTPQTLDQQAPVDQESPRRNPNRRSMMARSTTGTSNVSSCDAISGICNNHRLLAGIGTVSPVSLCSRTLVRERVFLTYDNAEYSIGGARVRKLGEGSSIPMAGTTDRMR